MRIAYLINQYPKISHTFIRREIDALEAQGFEIERYSLQPMARHVIDPADRREAERTTAVQAQPIWHFAAAITILAIQRPSPLMRALIRALSLGLRSPRGVPIYLIYWIEACWLARRLRHHTHLHVHFGTSSASVAYLCRVMGGPPYSLTIHSAEEYQNVASLHLAEKISAAAFTVAVCGFGRDQLAGIVPQECWPDLHVVVVHCSISGAFRDKTVRPPSKSRTLVCIARLDAGKGHAVLLDALHQMQPTDRPNRVVLVGDGPLRSELEAKIDRCGLRDSVCCVGWADEASVRQYLEAADLCVVPSTAEVLPVTIMEAFALGRPVIASNVGGIAELVCPQENGWLVPLGDADALASTLKEALNTSPERLAEMGLAGRAAVLERHDAATEAAKLAALFREVAAS